MPPKRKQPVLSGQKSINDFFAKAPAAKRQRLEPADDGPVAEAAPAAEASGIIGTGADDAQGETLSIPRAKVTALGTEQDAHPVSLLDTLMQRMRQYDLDKVGHVLERDDGEVQIELQNFLRSDILQLYEDGVLYELDDLRKLAEKDDFHHSNGLIYLHVVVGSNEVVRFYVGQTAKAEQRIYQEHKNEKYRAKNPSVHYEALSASVEDFYVELADLQKLQVDNDDSGRQEMFNILEMWGCLIFRSLQPKTLRKYLPPSIADGLDSSHGLNIRSPLLQGDSDTQGWAGWHDIMRSSTDPEAQKFYERCLLKMGENLSNYHVDNNANVRSQLLNGEWLPVTIREDKRRKNVSVTRTLNPRYVTINVPSELRTIEKQENGKVVQKIHVQCFLAAAGTEHPHYYVRLQSRAGDACRRLGILLTGVDAAGNSKSVWAETATPSPSGKDQDMAAQRANSLVDFLLEVPMDDTTKTPRRYVPEVKKRKVRTPGYYTN